MFSRERYRTPSPRYPTPSPTSLDRLLWTWEYLRQLDIEGYRTSAATPMSTWLVQINWAGGRVSSRSRGRGTTCSPFTTQSAALCYSDGDEPPFSPHLADGEPLPMLFSLSANSNLKPAHSAQMQRYGMTQDDNGWPRALIFFNMGVAIEPTQMRRGDAVHIDWAKGGGHAVFCWDVHLDENGEVDAFQYVSSNGMIQDGGRGPGVTVGGTPVGPDGFLRRLAGEGGTRYEALRHPLFVDDDRYVAEGTWVTWKPDLRIEDLRGCRVRPRGKLRLGKKILCARFHGVVAPEPYAMGGPAQGAARAEIAAVRPVSQDEPATPRQVARQSDDSATAGQHGVERRLKMLYALGLIDVDPGAPDSINDAHTQAAVRAFQRRYDLKPDGIVGPKTRARLRAVYAEAAATKAGRRYLAEGPDNPPDPSSAPEPAPEPPPPGLGTERSVFCYFRHGAAAAGDEVTLVVRASGADLEGAGLPVLLQDERSAAITDPGVVLTLRGGVGRVRVRVPPVAAGTRLVAVLTGEALATRTAAALVVAPGKQTAT